MSDPKSRRNLWTLGICAGVVLGMVGLTYASVPLYRIFCQVTGYGGTTQVARAVPKEVSDRVIKVRFDASTNPALPWQFKPKQLEMSLNLGETGLAFYEATNTASVRNWGTAVFNVTPQKVGQYFSKIDCFCFTVQHLEPGQSVDMPVTFFVDPRIADDPNAQDVHTITLSYTFYPLEEDERKEAERSLATSAQPEGPGAVRSQ